MPLVKNLRDHAVDVDVWELVGTTRVIELGARRVDPGCTIEVDDACAHGAPDALRAGLLDQPDAWALSDVVVGDGRGLAVEDDTPAQVPGDGFGHSLPPFDAEAERVDQLDVEPEE